MLQTHTGAQATSLGKPLERRSVNWINKILLLAGGLAAMVTLVGHGLGFGWLSPVAGLRTFIVSSALAPVFSSFAIGV
jgi:hypothetical protein